MAKRVAFSVLCTLLVLVVILTGIVIRRVSRILLWSAPQDPISTDATEPPTHPTAPTVPSTEPTHPQHEHDLVLTKSIKPTCEGYGWNIYTCSTCGYVDMPLDERQNPLGHDYDAGQVFAATCTEGGRTSYTCQRCYHSIEENVTDPLGHNFTLYKDVPPTCTEDGYTVLSCSNDGCAEVLETVIHEGTATGHTYGAWTYREDGRALPLCCVCFGDWSGSSGGPPSDVYSILDHSCSDLNHPVLGPYAFYSVQVGIANQPDAPVYLYSICDFLDTGTLLFYYDTQLGLVVRYEDQNGLPVQIILDPYGDQSATIPAAEPDEPPTEDPADNSSEDPA